MCFVLCVFVFFCVFCAVCIFLVFCVVYVFLVFCVFCVLCVVCMLRVCVCSEYVLKIFRYAHNILRICSEYNLTMFWPYSEYNLLGFRLYSESILNMFWTHSEYIEIISECIQSFRHVSEILDICLRILGFCWNLIDSHEYNPNRYLPIISEYYDSDESMTNDKIAIIFCY